jgi:hypothetical protein
LVMKINKIYYKTIHNPINHIANST